MIAVAMSRRVMIALCVQVCSLLGASTLVLGQSTESLHDRVYSGDSASSASELSIEGLVQRLEASEARLQALEHEQTLLRSEYVSFEALDTKGVAGDAAKVGDSKDSDKGKAKDSEKDKSKDKDKDKPKEKAWYEKFKIRGYTQVRINDVFDVGPGSDPAQHVSDGSIGDNQGFIIRRARLILQGDMSDHLAIYLQPDFASAVPGSTDSNQFAQIRDFYGDVHLDKTKIHRIRVGQSKIPYGWENMQSSSNRIPLDRTDPINSAARNERDLGVFYYWTPENAQKFYQSVLDDGVKGSGNYGVFGAGFYNGQGGSFREQNDNLHFVTRLNIPYTFQNGQRMEAGVQAYTGYYTVLSSTISPRGIGPAIRPAGTLEAGEVGGILDRRIAGSFIYYPEPFGFQAEWNVGRGPGLNDAQTAVIERDLHGGYAMTMYRVKTKCYGEWFPYYRFQYYEGGYKSERNAPFVNIKEHEMGLEWLITKQMELVSACAFTDRTNTRANSVANTRSYEQFVGSIARFQFQFNY